MKGKNNKVKASVCDFTFLSLSGLESGNTSLLSVWKPCFLFTPRNTLSSFIISYSLKFWHNSEMNQSDSGIFLNGVHLLLLPWCCCLFIHLFISCCCNFGMRYESGYSPILFKVSSIVGLEIFKVSRHQICFCTCVSWLDCAISLGTSQIMLTKSPVYIAIREMLTESPLRLYLTPVRMAISRITNKFWPEF